MVNTDYKSGAMGADKLTISLNVLLEFVIALLLKYIDLFKLYWQTQTFESEGN